MGNRTSGYDGIPKVFVGEHDEHDELDERKLRNVFLGLKKNRQGKRKEDIKKEKNRKDNREK